MMVDRRAIVIGSWLNNEKFKLSSQKVTAVTKHWSRIFKHEKYGFKSSINENALPTPIHNPTISELTSQFTNAKKITINTELLIYYLGNSTPYGPNDILLSLGDKPDGEREEIEFSRLLGIIGLLPNSINRLILILDTCHVGRDLPPIVVPVLMLHQLAEVVKNVL